MKENKKISKLEMAKAYKEMGDINLQISEEFFFAEEGVNYFELGTEKTNIKAK
ncbi:MULTISPECIES: hypothetical protein [Bacillus]|uniref:hypothetical protein n=1 Tax=Bacillus TaxID=1386 RepID=UPI0015819AD6|nr:MULTISPECIES: hypothetical protein [Bacillus]GIN67046.1 hypothetical protein J41TS2_24670 [Bacillus sonorensis]